MPNDNKNMGKVVFIGLGAMGDPMVRQLASAGFDLCLFDLDTGRAAKLASETGTATAASASEAAAGAAFAITMLPDGRAVRAVLIDAGVADALAPGALCIDMSSSDPVGTQNLGAELAEKGLSLLDAPVSGGVRRAVNGTLAIMVGGSDADLERCRPLLDVMGGSIHHAGPLGAGHAIKALNNYLSASGTVAAAEALRVGEAFGLDPQTMTDIFNESTGRNNATVHKLMQHIAPRTYGAGFTIGLMEKDLRTAMSLAKNVGVEAPFAQACLEYWQEALRVSGPSADHTAVVDKPPKKD